MQSLYDSLKPWWNKEFTKSIYDERIECFKKLTEIQQNLKNIDEDYLTVSTNEGKTHENALVRLEHYTKEYKREYALCETIIKMK